MRNHKGLIAIGIIAFIIGLAFVVVHGQANMMSFIIELVGIMFVVPAIYSLLSSIYSKNKVEGFGRSMAALISAIGACALGLYMFIAPDAFVSILCYLFAGVMIMGGLYHILVLLIDRNNMKSPSWFFILPICIIIAGLIIVFTDLKQNESMVILITGIALMAFSLNMMFEIILFGSIKKITH